MLGVLEHLAESSIYAYIITEHVMKFTAIYLNPTYMWILFFTIYRLFFLSKVVKASVCLDGRSKQVGASSKCLPGNDVLC